jgi:DNA anti-recombination protein RmuC
MSINSISEPFNFTVTSENEPVIKIRDIKSQIDAAKGEISSSNYKNIVTAFLQKISANEEDLYQVKNQSGQDPLNFAIRLNNRLASLRRSMENGDEKLTNGAYKVFKELSTELEQHLEKLNQTLSSDLPSINKLLHIRLVSSRCNASYY